MPGKKLWEIYVPVVQYLGDNTQQPFTIEHHKEWDAFVANVAGGLSILPTVKGRWVEPRDKYLYKEDMIPVRVVAFHNEMEIIVDFTKKHYKQIAVFAFVVSETVIIS